MLLYIVVALVKLFVFHSCTIDVFFSICANIEVYYYYYYDDDDYRYIKGI